MVTPVALQALLGRGAQLVEVLPVQEYDEMYLPGPVNIPLKTLDAATACALDRVRPGRYLLHDAVTAALDDRVPNVRVRVEAGDHDVGLVLARDATLLGRPRRSVLEAADPDASAGQVMEPGPSILRPHEPAAAMRDRLIRHHPRSPILTDPKDTSWAPSTRTT